MAHFCKQFLCAILCASIAFCAATFAVPMRAAAEGETPSGEDLAGLPAAVAKGLTARAYILIEATTGRVLAGGNQSERLPMASTTKIMTALLTLEQPNLEEEFTVDPAAIKVEGSSMGLPEGDRASLHDLAYGMLLSSGNDAANAAAVRIDGSIPKFVERMNRRAQEMGMKNTRFVTPSGLPADDHYSTAEDMALLARYAIANPRFAEICQLKKAKLSFGNPPFDRWLSNHNKLLEQYPGCIGMKTGFTKAAGRCLVSAARRNDVTLICVTLHDPNDWRDHAQLFDFGFTAVVPWDLAPDCSKLRLKVVGGAAKTAPVRALDATPACVTQEQMASVEQEVHLDRFYYAPIREGDVVGRIVHRLNGFVVAETDLVAAADVPLDATPRRKSLFDRVKEFWREHVK